MWCNSNSEKTCERYPLEYFTTYIHLFGCYSSLVMVGLSRCPYHPKFIPCGPTTNLQNFLFTFWCLLWRSNFTTVDRIHWSSEHRLFKVQISCLPHPWFQKNYVLLSEWFPNLITHTQQKVSTTYHCEQFFSKWSMPRVRCIYNCQIITCLMCSIYQLFDLTLTSFCDCKNKMSY